MILPSHVFRLSVRTRSAYEKHRASGSEEQITCPYYETLIVRSRPEAGPWTKNTLSVLPVVLFSRFTRKFFSAANYKIWANFGAGTATIRGFTVFRRPAKPAGRSAKVVPSFGRISHFISLSRKQNNLSKLFFLLGWQGILFLPSSVPIWALRTMVLWLSKQAHPRLLKRSHKHVSKSLFKPLQFFLAIPIYSNNW